MVRFRSSVALLASFGLLSCGAPNFVPVRNPVASVKITPANDTIPFQGTVTLSVAALDVDGQPTIPAHRPIWSSLSPEVLVVDTLGLVRSVWYGEGVIHVLVDGVEAQAPVVARTPPIVSVTVSPTLATPERGDTVQYHASARNSVGLPANVSVVHWLSSDTTRVRIDSTGRAIAVGVGPAQVSATVDSVAGSTGVAVLVPTASVTVTPDTFTLAFDDTVTLKVVARDSAGNVLTDRPIHLVSTALQTPASLAPLDSFITVRAVSAGTGALVAFAGRVADTARGTVEALTFRSVSPGGWFTCAVTVDSAAYCWGRNTEGELGSGDTLSGPRPRRVAGGLKFASVTAGQTFACGLTADGTAWCWGDNTYGGLGTTGPSSGVPVPVSGGHAFAVLSASSNTACGLTGAGAVYCWAYGWGATPTAAGTGAGAYNQIVVGGDGECGTLAANNSIYCWSPSTAATFLVASSPVVLQTYGNWSLSCGLSSGTAYCWGWWPVTAFDFQGRRFDSYFPTATFTQTSSGIAFFCGLTPTGTLACRGDNAMGQLGNGAQPGFSDSLVSVVAPVAFTSISAGEFHACAFGTNGRLYCWGENDLGESGSTLYPKNVFSPQPVMGQP